MATQWMGKTIILTVVLTVILTFSARAQEGSPVIGIAADMSAASAESGQAIRVGAQIAIDEINESGGVLGRKLALEVLDSRGNPVRGRDAVSELADRPDVVAIIGSKSTPMALHALDVVHEKKVPFLIPWAAGTPVIDNGYTPNYAFRVSVRDEYAGGFLVDAALKRGHKRIAILLERTPWGRSNETAIVNALSERGMAPASVNWLNRGATSLESQLAQIRRQGADVILLVCGSFDGATVLRDVAALPEDQRLPIISHWGLTAGVFFDRVGWQTLKKVNLAFLQTYSFLKPTNAKKAEAVLARYYAIMEGAEEPRDVVAAPGVAHAYDLVHLLALAVIKTGSFDRTKIRDALERLDAYDGLVRRYDPPFTPDRHDALTADDFTLATYAEDGAIIPVDVNQ